MEIERQQARQRLVLAYVGRPAIGGGDRRVEVAVRVVEPGRTLVIEIGQGAGLEDGARSRVDRQDAVGKTGHDLRLALDQIGRVQPGLAASAASPEAIAGDRTAALIPSGRFEQRVDMSL
jgi:hypothetical protein